MTDNIPRIGNDEQSRWYRGVEIHIKFRPKTKDFEWYFTQTRTIKIDGHANTIEKCVKAAQQYIDVSKGGTIPSANKRKT